MLHWLRKHKKSCIRGFAAVSAVFDGANDITVNTINICKTLAISLPSPADMPMLIRLSSPSAARTLAVTKDNVSFLCELNEDELIYNSSSDTGTINKESFKAVLEKFKKDKPEG